MLTYAVIVPARDEEPRIGACLDAIRAAAHAANAGVEVVVVTNRCTDRTADVARAHGARVIDDPGHSLAAVRNAGARASQSDVIVTVDADSLVSPNTFVEIDRALASGRCVGGGVPIRPERMSPGILVSVVVLALLIAPLGVSAGLFWCWRRDFEAIGGFDERRRVAEDVDFALRLKAHARASGRRTGTLRRAPIRTSCRKFDRFGDWFFLRLLVCHPVRVWRMLRGHNDPMVDQFFYRFQYREDLPPGGQSGSP